MLSLKTALKLKVAGLEWEPQEGDFFAAGHNIFVISGSHDVIDGTNWFFGASPCVYGEGCLCNGTFSFVLNETGLPPSYSDKFYTSKIADKIWHPRLDQLLNEIEESNHSYCISTNYEGHKYVIEITFDEDIRTLQCFKSEESLEDAVAQALLWILEQEKEG